MGILSMFTTKREAFPTIDFDMVVVQTIYPGSSPTEVEKFITTPIEIELKQVDDIDEMTSTSSEGRSIITLKLDPDADDKDKTINDIQQAVDRVTDLPSDLEDEPLVTEVTTKNQPTISMSLWGDLSVRELQEEVLRIEKLLLEEPSIAKINRNGYLDPEVHIEINPDDMNKYHVGFNDLVIALANQNINIPGGSIYQQGQEYLLKISGEFKDLEDIKNVVVRSTTSGQNIKIKDIAHVREGFEKQRVINLTNGQTSINLTVVRKESGDTITVVEKTKEIMNRYLKNAPGGLKVHYFDDISIYITRRIQVLQNNGIVGMAFVVLSLFLFLSFRVAIGACISIPIVIAITFSMMNWFGVSINLLSLFGLIMVLGMVVDEDIVVAENIFRHLEMGKKPKEAIIQGASEISRAVFATVCTTIAAFIPLYLMTGTTGKFVQNIPMVVNFALIASLIVALFVLPSHLFYLTKNMKREEKKKNSKIKNFFDNLSVYYEKILKIAVRFRYVVVGFFVILLIGSGVFARYQMNYIMFPSGGIEKFYLRVEGDLGDALETTAEKIKPIIKEIKKLPDNELENYITQIGMIQEGSDTASSNQGGHLAQIEVFLTSISKRERDAFQIIDELRNQLKDKHQFKSLSFDVVKAGPPTGKPIQIGVKGDDLSTLTNIAGDITRFLSEIDGVLDIKDDSQEFIFTQKVNIDLEKAARAGLDVNSIAQNVRTAFEGRAATVIKTLDEDIDVVVKFPDESQYNFDDLENLPLLNQSGNLIPLNKIASFSQSRTLRNLKHEDKQRLVKVSANIDEKITDPSKVLTSFNENFKNYLEKYPGYSFVFLGEQKENQESIQSLLMAFFISFSLIFIILVAMFRSLIDPIIILITIPFGAIGVIWSLFFHGMPLSFMAMLGLVALTGVIANSAIIIIDFIRKSKDENTSHFDSIIEGSVVRFRPVVLTSMTTALGVIPAAYGIGGNDPFIQPMALTLNYGLIFGSTLSLIFVPCLVAISNDLRGLFRLIKKY